MQPIPETVQAIEELGPFLPEGDLLEQLDAIGRRVAALVPDCVGLSVASYTHGVTFTLVASDEEIGVLDAVQYLAGGPCVASAEDGRVVTFSHDDGLDEETWHEFALATAASGVGSTLTLPLISDQRVSGTVNLYAATPHAFEGHHDEVALIVGAWAPGAVTNADLSFSTRRDAEQAPRLLADANLVDLASGIVAESGGLDVATARERIRGAARRAGVTEVQLAEAIVELKRG